MVITLSQLTGFTAGLPCVGKKRFLTIDEAEKAVHQLTTAGHDRPELGRLHAYRCSVCGTYHIGHRRPQAVLGDSRKGAGL